MIKQAVSQTSTREDISVQFDPALKKVGEADQPQRLDAQVEPSLNRLRALSVFVTAGGAVVVAAAAIRQFSVADYTWLTMVALAIFVAPMGTIHIPGVKARVTLGDTITFACAAIFGPDAAVIAAVADGLVTSLRMTSNPRKVLYNIAMCSLSMGGAALATRSLSPSFGSVSASASIAEMTTALGFFTLSYFLLSTSLVASYVALSSEAPVLKVWRENFLWTSVSYAASGVSALGVYILVGRLSYYSFLIPVGLMAFVSLFYRAYFQKVESEKQRADFIEEQLRQSQKMEALGRLAGGVAHDFNNLLTAILIYSELFLQKLDETDPLRKHIEEINKAGMRASSLTRQLLAFSRKQILQPKVINLNSIVEEMKDMLKRLIGEDIDLITLLDPQLGTIKADPGQIEQVIMNLAINSRDAMPQGGKLIIETENVSPNSDAGLPVKLRGQTCSHIALKVSDTGCGMDKETLSRIFEPFFTTKEEGKGTGLGLSTVYGIVNQSNGDIQVESEPGRGTTFSIYLPQAVEPRASVETRSSAEDKQRASETILLVENEEIVRVLIQSILKSQGYKVLEAANGKEAVRICNQYEGVIDLLLTDVVMPQMSGRQLAEALVESRPDMKSLFISGHTEDAVVRYGVLVSGVNFLQKPFVPEALIRKVREVLRSKR